MKAVREPGITGYLLLSGDETQIIMNYSLIWGLFSMMAAIASAGKSENNLQIAAANGHFKINECKLKKGTMKIYIPGCELKTIKGLGCQGYCLSSTKPGVPKTMKAFYQQCTCCQPKGTKTKIVSLYCPALKIKSRKLKVHIATKCHCTPCKS